MFTRLSGSDLKVLSIPVLPVCAQILAAAEDKVWSAMEMALSSIEVETNADNDRFDTKRIITITVYPTED